MKGVTIRQADERDYALVGQLHAASWKTTYRGILPDAFLEGEVDAERTNYWREKLPALSSREFVLVAAGGGGIAGFAAVLDKPEHGYEAFIDNLHVRPDLKGKGIGGLLMKEVAVKLKASGRGSVYLWVLKGNDAAEKFYLSKGGSPADVGTVSFAGKRVWQTRFVWPTLDALLAIES